MNLSPYIAIVLASLLCACGGGSSSPSPSPTSPTSTPSPAPSPTPSPMSGGDLIGTFKSGASVQGLEYMTESGMGFTNEEGEFNYSQGDSVTFMIGDIVFPSVDAATEISSFDLVSGSDLNNRRSINLARLIQSLDEDGDDGNGIQIPTSAHDMAAGLSVDFNSDSFDSELATYVANAGGDAGILPTGLSVLQKYAASLGASSACGSSDARVGDVANLATFAYGTAGVVTIVNNCTVLITHFNYSGGGLPDVRFYTGPNAMFSNGRVIGPNVFGQQFNNANMVINIEAADLNTLDAISLWCVAANVSFGDGQFFSVY